MKEQIKKYIIETFLYGEGSLEDDDQLFESGIIDSMGFIKLLSHIEETFKVSIGMDEVSMENFGTVNDIMEVINQKMKKE
jgi:acyl carrier protein